MHAPDINEVVIANGRNSKDVLEIVIAIRVVDWSCKYRNFIDFYPGKAYNHVSDGMLSAGLHFPSILKS